jgi:hypothetical protein
MSMESVPRLGSLHDAAIDTSVSDVPGDLARLADVASVPRALDAARGLTLDPFEAWMYSVVRLGMCVQGILDISPLSEDETLQLLARLVGKGAITFTRGGGARHQQA